MWERDDEDESEVGIDEAGIKICKTDIHLIICMPISDKSENTKINKIKNEEANRLHACTCIPHIHAYIYLDMNTLVSVSCITLVVLLCVAILCPVWYGGNFNHLHFKTHFCTIMCSVVSTSYSCSALLYRSNCSLNSSLITSLDLKHMWLHVLFRANIPQKNYFQSFPFFSFLWTSNQRILITYQTHFYNTVSTSS